MNVTILGFLVLYALPVGSAIWAWRKWMGARRSQPAPKWRRFLSVAALVLGSSSLLVAAVSVTHAQVIGGFPYYEPLLLGYMRVGFDLAVLGLGIAWLGIRGTRLAISLLSMIMLLFWVAAATGE